MCNNYQKGIRIFYRDIEAFGDLDEKIVAAVGFYASP